MLIRPDTIDGDPQIDAVNGLSVEEMRHELNLTREHLPFALNAHGKALLGDRFWNTWIELLGVHAESIPESCEWPLINLAGLPLQVWRQRIFWFRREILVSATKEPFVLDLRSPSVPYLEMTWSPERGNQKALRGLENIPPEYFTKEISDLTTLTRNYAIAFIRMGRRPLFRNADHYKQSLDAAMQELTKRGKRVTQPAILSIWAETNERFLECDVRSFNNWNRAFKIDWRALVGQTGKK